MAKKMEPDNNRKVNIIFIVLIANVLMGCISEIFSTKPMASFEFNPTNNIKTGDTITFTNNSKNADFYYWDFGDSWSSNEKNPKHAFQNKRNYLVKLSISKQTEIDGNYAEETDTLSKNVNVSIGVPVSCFEYKQTSNHTIVFTDCSFRVTEYLWDFGDGTTSTEKSPTHTFSTYGLFKVLLTTSNDGISDTISKTIDVTDIVNIENTPIEWYNGLTGKYIDVDSDGRKDFFVYGHSHTGPSQSTSEKSIMPLGDYGIVYDSINVDVWVSYENPANYSKKFYIPKKFMLGNTIFNSEETTTENIRFSFSYYTYYSSTSYNSWDKDEVRYVGYKNKNGNNTKIGWIKLNLFGPISLYSFKMPIEGTSLLIEN